LRVEKREVLFEGEHIRIRKDYIPQGAWETVELKRYKRSAIVLAVTEEQELILEKHYRFPVDSYVIELPAGLAEEDEDVEHCARRELLEETGYQANTLIHLFSGFLCPGLTYIEAHYFYAPNVKYIGMRNLEPTEDIEILKVPLSNVIDFLLNLPEDVKFGVNVLSGLYALENYLKREKRKNYME